MKAIQQRLVRLSTLAGLVAAGALVGAPSVRSDDSSAPPSRESLLRQVEELKAPDVAWRKIPWKSCLLEGLRESRRSGKPLLLWVFIDRPVDDARC